MSANLDYFENELKKNILPKNPGYQIYCKDGVLTIVGQTRFDKAHRDDITHLRTTFWNEIPAETPIIIKHFNIDNKLEYGWEFESINYASINYARYLMRKFGHECLQDCFLVEYGLSEELVGWHIIGKSSDLICNKCNNDTNTNTKCNNCIKKKSNSFDNWYKKMVKKILEEMKQVEENGQIQCICGREQIGLINGVCLQCHNNRLSSDKFDDYHIFSFPHHIFVDDTDEL